MKNHFSLPLIGFLFASLGATAETITLTPTQIGRWSFVEPMILLDPAQPQLGYQGGGWNKDNRQTPEMNTYVWAGWTDGCRHITIIDFKSLPSNIKTIHSATLRLQTDYNHIAVPLTIQSFSVAGTWDVNTPIAKMPKAAVTGGTFSIPTTYMGDVELEVKDIVSNWAAQGNTSILIAAPAGPEYPDFRQFHATGIAAPHITLDYTSNP